jgi:hypothetical protein
LCASIDDVNCVYSLDALVKRERSLEREVMERERREVVERASGVDLLAHLRIAF